MANVLLRIVNARHPVPNWLMAIISSAAGLLVILFIYFGKGNLAGFTNALIVDGYLWGPLTFGAGILAMYGMSKGLHNRPLKLGSMLSFGAWLLGVIAGVDTGDTVALLISLPLSAFWAYMYMASYVRIRN